MILRTRRRLSSSLNEKDDRHILYEVLFEMIVELSLGFCSILSYRFNTDGTDLLFFPLYTTLEVLVFFEEFKPS